MQKIYIFLIAICSLFNAYSQDFTQVTNTCIGEFSMIDDDISLPKDDVNTLPIQIGNNDDYELTLSIPQAEKIYIYDISKTLINNDVLNFIDGASTLYDRDSTKSSFTSNSNSLTVYFFNDNTTATNISFKWKGVITADTLVSDVSCNGGNDGQAQVFPNGGTEPYTYLWNTAATTRKITGLSANNYKVTITDANGCVFEDSLIVGQPETLITTGVVISHDCSSGSDTGSLTATTSGGTLPYAYEWSTGSTNDTILNLSATAYTFTVTDANGCTDNDGGTILYSGSDLGEIVPSITDVECKYEATGSITIGGSNGEGSYTYEWGSEAGNSTNSTITNLSAGTYNYTITDGNNCTFSNSQVVTEPSDSLKITLLEKVNVSYYGGNNGSIAVDSSGTKGSAVYTWSSSLGSNDTVNNLAAGNYAVTLSEGSCSTEANYNISQPSATYAGSIAINGLTDSTICANNNSITISSSIDGDSPNVTEYSWEFSTDNVNWSDTSAISTNNYVFSWYLNESIYAKRIATDNVTLNSSESNIVHLTLSNLNATVTEDKKACFGEAIGGQVTIKPSGSYLPYSLSWNGGPTNNFIASDSVIDGLDNILYNYVITDDNGCTINSSITITENPQITVTNDSSEYLGFEVTCFGENDGWVQVTAGGGSGNYSYSWDASASYQSTDSAVNLRAGTYSFTITDDNGCSFDSTRQVRQPGKLAIIVDSSALTYYGSNDGYIHVTGLANGVENGDLLDYSYSWSGNGISGTAVGDTDKDNLTAGTYAVTITDENGCMVDSSWTLSQPTQMSAGTIQIGVLTNIAVCNPTTTFNFVENAGASGGSSNFVYDWISSPDDATWATIVSNETNTFYDWATTLTEDTYVRRITKDNNTAEVDTSNAVFLDLAELTASYVEDTIACYNESNGATTVSISGGTAPYSIDWGNTATFIELLGNDTTIRNLHKGPYNFTVRDDNNCEFGDTRLLSENPRITVANDSSENLGFEVSCFNGDDGWIEVTPTGGTSGYTVLWDANTGNQTANRASNLEAGTYSFTVTDNIGCTFDSTRQVRSPGKLQINIDSVNVSFNDNNDGYIHITSVTNALETNDLVDYIYDWSGPGVTGSGIGDNEKDNLIAGFYAVTVTDENLCEVDSIWEITEPSKLLSGSIEVNSSSSEVICEGNKPTIFSNVTAASQGGAPITYTWESSVNQSTWNIIAGSSGSSYTWDSIIEQDFYIRRKASNTNGDSAYSNILFLDFQASTTVTITNLNAEYCHNGNMVTLIGNPAGSSGVFSGPGIVPLGNGLAEFTPAVDTSSSSTISLKYRYVNNTCADSSVRSVIIRPHTTPSFSIIDKIAVNSEYEIIDETPTGGTFSGAGVTPTGTFYSKDLTVGTTYDVNYEYPNAYGCVGTFTDQTTVIQGAGKFYTDAGYSNELGTKFCFDADSFRIYANPFNDHISGQFLGLITNTGTPFEGWLHPADYSNSADNKYLIKYAYEGSGGFKDTIEHEISVFDIADKAEILDLEPKYCLDGNSQEVMIHAKKSSEGSGNFSSPFGIIQNYGDSALFDVQTMPVTNGTPHTISYQYDHIASGCSFTREQDVNIYNEPNVSFNIKDTFNVQESAKPFEDLVPASGGSFSGTGGVTGSSFNPQGLSLGDYSITYSYTDASTGCDNQAVQSVYVDTAKGNFSGLVQNAIYCSDGAADTIVYLPDGNSHTAVSYILYTPIDTVEMSTNNDTLVIVPDTLSGGTHTIRYTYLNADGATSFVLTKTFVIDDVGTPSIDAPKLDFCNYDNDVTLYGEINNNISGRGLFSGVGLILDITNDGQATFVPTSANIGSTEIAYVYNSTYPNSSCAVYDTIVLTVHDRPALTLNIESVYNVDGENDTLVATPAGGTFTPSEYFEKDNIFNPSKAGIGIKPITYEFTDEFGCENSTVSDANVETVTGSISNLQNYYCYDDGEVTLTYTGLSNPSSAIGTFAGKGITDLGNNTAIFNPQVAYDSSLNSVVDSIATITIEFEYLGSDNSTLFSKVQTTKIRNNGVITVSNLNDTTGYCANNEVVELSATPKGGEFSGIGISGQNFTPSEVNDTATIISYTFTHSESGCSISNSDTVPILLVPELIFNVPNRVCSNAEVDTLVGYPRGGEITSQLSIAQLGGFTDSVKFTPNPDFIGLRNITYTYTNPDNNCTNAITKSIVTDTIPAVSIDFSMPEKGFCHVNTQIGIEGVVNEINALSGIFKGKGINDTTQNNGEGIYNPILAGIGDDLITFTYTDANGCTNLATFEAKVNALPNLSINRGALKDTAFCGNDAERITLNGYYQTGSDVRFIIENQTFYTSQHDFIPMTYGDRESVTIEFHNTDENNCYNYVTETIDILKVPERTFSMSTICIANPIDFTYKGSFKPSDIDSVLWEFGDGEESKLFPSTSHKYEVPEELQVRFRIWAKNGCSNDTITPFKTLETSPNAYFDWKYECITDDSVVFESASQEGTYKHLWDFGDSTIDTTRANPGKKYDEVGSYSVNHTVRSGFSTCKSEVTRTINIRPTFTILPDDDYFEDFENGNGSWIPEKLDTASNAYSWQLGTPAGKIINTTPNNIGDNVYATNLTSYYDSLENSAITSPCFVFDNIYRPMISMDIYRDLDGSDDGVVMEYTKDHGDTWLPLNWQADINEGINWFNALNLRSQPGSNSNMGWADQGLMWEDSRHDLDNLIDSEGKSNGTVRFRIAFESDEYTDTINGYEGFAFDNIRIGDRKRRVLVEHFTNTEISSVKNSDLLINDIVNDPSIAIDAIDIQYHTSHNTEDPFYSNYPIGSSSRESYYGVNNIPFTYLDGEVIFDYEDSNVPSAISIKSQALTDPSFKMSIESANTASSMNVKIKATALENIENRQLQLFVAIVEKAVTINDEELVYENVLRSFLPTPGGTYIASNWEVGDSFSDNFDYTIDDFILNSDTLVAIAFIQDEITKEILQTISTDAAHLSTSVKPWLGINDGLDFILYPNPANERVYFGFGKNPSMNSEIQILDQSGKLIDKVQIPENTTTSFHDLSHLKEGIYFVKWINGKEQKVKKLIKVH